MIILLLAISPAVFPPEKGWADGLNGYAEFTNANSKTKSILGGVETENIKSNSFTQRYNLTFDRALYPLLRLSAGGIFEKNMTDLTLNGVDSESGTTQLSPFITLGIGTKPITASVGYSRNEVTASGSGAAEITDILENYTGRLGLRPEGLPTLDLLFSRSNSFDSERVTHDSTSDYYSVSSRYQPLNNLNLLYSGSLINSEDKINGQKTQVLNNALRGDFTENYFYRRVNLATSATMSHQKSTIEAGAGGSVLLPISPGPLNGLSATTTSTTIITVSEGQLTDTDALLNGTAQINLVTPATELVDNSKRINLGVEFPNQTTVDTLFIQFTTDNPAVPSFNPNPINVAALTSNFSWEIYVSANGISWTKVADVVNAPVSRDPLLLVPANVGFVLNFPEQTTRFIKAVVAPPQLSGIPPAGVNLNLIQATAIQTFRRITTAGTPKQSFSSLSGFMDTVVRTKILEKPGFPSLLHDLTLNYNFNKSDNSKMTTSWLVSNGLSSFYTFNRYLTGNARLSWEETGQTGQEGESTYNLSASLQAVPLATLRHTLVYSGRYTTSAGDSAKSNSFFLSNSAVLYRGLSASLNGGISFTTDEAGRESTNVNFTGGINAIPHRTLNLNLGYSETHSKSSGGGTASGTSFTRTGELSAAYNPISAVFLFASFGFNAENDRETRITQNFGGGWSPFRDGALQLTTAYNETLSSEGDERVRTFSSSMRWNIRPGWWLEATYAIQKTDETFEGVKNKTDTDSLISTLRIAF